MGHENGGWMNEDQRSAVRSAAEAKERQSERRLKLIPETLRQLGCVEQDDGSWWLSERSTVRLVPIRNDDGSLNANTAEDGYWLVCGVACGTIGDIVHVVIERARQHGEAELRGKLQALLGISR